MGTPSLWYRFREWLSVLLFPDFWEWYGNMAKRNWELEEDKDRLLEQLVAGEELYISRGIEIVQLEAKVEAFDSLGLSEKVRGDELEAENAALKREIEVLRKYADHKGYCRARLRQLGDACVCGYTDALRTAEEQDDE